MLPHQMNIAHPRDRFDFGVMVPITHLSIPLTNSESTLYFYTLHSNMVVGTVRGIS
jgi:hypothetical protein